MGCILAELNLQNAFIAGHGSDQLRNIFHIFGTPTAESWGPVNVRFGTKKGQDFNGIFDDPELTDFLKYIMVMNPAKRVTAAEAMKHNFCVQ